MHKARTRRLQRFDSTREDPYNPAPIRPLELETLARELKFPSQFVCYIFYGKPRTAFKRRKR